MQIKPPDFLNKKNGKHAWYVVLTNEIIINNRDGNPNYDYELYLEFIKETPLYVSDVIYLGEL